MPYLPALTSKKIIRALKHSGFLENRQKGSHIILFNSKTKARTVIPMHARRTLKRSLVYAIISDAKLSPKEFLKLL